MRAPIVLAVMLLCCFGEARAQNLDDTPLASCPGYVANHPIISQISWSVNCFLKALETEDRALAVAIAPTTKCVPADPEHCIDGIMEESGTSAFFGGLPYSKRSFHEMVVAAKSVTIFYEDGGDDRVDVIFSLAPEKGKVSYANGWTSGDFFHCPFFLDRNIWIVEGVCRMDVTDLDESFMIDLSGESSVLPPMIWKPGKNKAK